MRSILERWVIFIFLGLPISMFASAQDNPYYLRTSLYLDWFGAQYQGDSFLNQVSTRLKFEFSRNPEREWTFLMDLRDRYNIHQGSRNQFLVYDARLVFNSQRSPLYFSAGQMNLYDTAGIGQLLGGILGYKLNSSLLLGGYAGLEQSVYFKLDTHYQKYGLFAKYTGPGAKSLSLSYNHVRFSGQTEQQYIYAQGMLPIQKTLFLYGNVEFELGPHVASGDRFSQVFLNARLDLTRYADLGAFFSSGKGLDFHRYVLERSQDPILNDRELERFYYSRQFGARLSIKPTSSIRLYVSRQESEQKDLHAKNHTWRLGASAWDIFKTGFSFYGDYAFNRGDLAESDSYYLSLNKDLGQLSWYVTFSNTFNGVRYSSATGTPEVIHLSDSQNLSTSIFFPLNRRIFVSLEYNRFFLVGQSQNLFFVRLIFKK